MDRNRTLRVLGVLGLLAIIGGIVLTVVTQIGIGVDTQLIGSDWEVAGVVTGVLILVAIGTLVALAQPWRSTNTVYW